MCVDQRIHQFSGNAVFVAVSTCQNAGTDGNPCGAIYNVANDAVSILVLMYHDPMYDNTLFLIIVGYSFYWHNRNGRWAKRKRPFVSCVVAYSTKYQAMKSIENGIVRIFVDAMSG